MESNRLQIRRLSAEYLVSAEHPSPERLKDKLDRTLGSHLKLMLSSALSSWFSEADSSLWFVRRLEIDVAVNAAWDNELLGRAVTTQIGRALGDTLQENAEPDNVVHFTSRGDYLARFLSDLAAGNAWNRWYYESFAGLGMLPTSAALRTVVCDQTEPGREALLQLSPSDLRDVLRALSQRDAAAILDRLATTAAAVGDEADCCRIVWNAWQTMEQSSLCELDESRRALLLYLRASGDQQLGWNLKRASLALLRLASRLAGASAGQKEQLVSALTDGTMGEFDQVAGADAEILSPLRRCSAAWLREVGEAINTRPAKQTPGESNSPGRRYTSFGGAFLLLPFIDKLPLADAVRNWPHSNEAAAISLVRLLLLVKCCGEQNSHQSFEDPLLRDLLLIPPSVSLEEVREWGSQVSRTDVQNFLRTVLEWQRAQGAIAGSKQILAQAVFQEMPVVLLIDGLRGLWVMVQPEDPPCLVNALRVPLAQLERDDGVLLCDASLLQTLWPEFPSLRMINISDEEAAEDQVNRILRRLDKLPDELAHLALPEKFHLAPELDLTLSLVAQHVLRTFAWQIPGFAPSNLPYLWANFLNFSASLDDEAERRVVLVGRPPLHLVLGPTGLLRQVYRVSWLDERPLMLFEES